MVGDETSGGGVHALGVDVGSTNTKIALIRVDSDGTVREAAIRSRPTPADAAELAACVADGIREVLQRHPARVEVVGIASMAETGVPLAADGRALTGLIRWNSDRGADDLNVVVAQFGERPLFEATGVPARPKVTLATWRWLHRTHDDLWGRMAQWAGAADLIGLALTGSLVTDHTLAARTMAYRLPPLGERLPSGFDADLLAAVGLHPAQLPTVAVPGEASGTVTAEAAQRTGLSVGTPVVIAGHDHVVGAWAAGTRHPGDAADSLGSAEALVRVLGPAADREAVRRAGMSLARTVTGEHECLLAGAAAAGSLVGWWFEHLLPGLGRDEVFAAVDAMPPGPGPLLVLPYPSGRQAPAPDPRAQLRILLPDATPVDPATRTPADLTRGLLEGLCLQLRWMDDAQRSLTQRSLARRSLTAPVSPGSAADPPPAGALRVLGGPGAANLTWLALKQAVLGRDLETVSVREPVASGAALLAAVRLGLAVEEAALPWKTVSSAPGEPGDAERYAERYRHFVAAATVQNERPGETAPLETAPLETTPLETAPHKTHQATTDPATPHQTTQEQQ